MLKWLLLGLLLLCVEVTLAVILVTDQAVQAAIATERALAADGLGDRVAAQVEEQANRGFNRRFVHTGVVAASYATLLPDEQVRRRSNVLADMGSKDVFPYLEGRLHVLWDTVRNTLRTLPPCPHPFRDASPSPIRITRCIDSKLR